MEKNHKLILAVAPNGSRRDKTDHPAIPLTKEEILREAPRWRDAGASVLHLHVRDRDGRHSLDPDAYRDLFAALRNAIGGDMVLQMTTEAGGVFAREAQLASLRAVRPEAASIALREIAPDETDKRGFAELLGWMRREKIAPQLILYDREDLHRLIAWTQDGTVDGPALSVLFVLGRYASGQQSNPVDLLSFLGVAPLPFRDWMVCAFGRQEARCAALAALLGGHVRVGFENNVHLPDGEIAKDNAESVRATAAMLKTLHMEIGDAGDARALWRIG